MNWYILIAASVVDVVYAIALFYSKGFTLWKPTAVSIGAAILTSYLLALSMRTIPVGVAFVVWCGLASLGVVAYGIAALGETLSATQIAMMALILIGVGGLKLLSPV
jgi:quaternary ammonium compound-resistance protein SugE